MLTVTKIGLAIVVALFVAWASLASLRSWQRSLNNHQHASSNEQEKTESGIQLTGTPENSSVGQEAREEDKLTQSQKREAAQKRQELAVQRDIAKFNHQLVKATWVIGIVGIFTTVVLFFTLLFTKRAAEHIPRVERAYVFPKIIDIVAKVEKQTTRINLAVENVGKTPGFVKLALVGFFFDSPGLSEPHYPPDAQVQFLNTVVSAGGKSAALFPEHLIINRTLPFFCAGYIDYQDIFRDKHITRFLVRVDPQRREVEPAGLPAWNDWT